MIPIVDAGEEQVEISYTSGKNVKWHNYFGSLIVFCTVKHTLTIWLNHSTPRYLTKETKTYAHTVLYMNDHSTHIHYSLKLDIT